ncbi:CGNR zinc finger domain-containing protein [Actinomadura sp. WMMB 499]|uniref:CGNR zinc finger domain-containing protein n=1 Tax=Actinomadura sp. WMMB 499 TaxID=1219491 RepID=UPI001246A5E1|nr:CGNR zinc finger domain-containing protein [Actinomadura sp. WMMB 499]QFG22661.1 CGNR zinc finger domain-containing protein [Actinomadura sp. WMMB 499]
MHFNAYGGTGSLVAVDLLNAPDRGHATLSRVLAAHQISRPDLTPEQANNLASWLELVRPVFGEADTGRQVDTLNDLLRTVATGVQIGVHDGSEPHLHYVNQAIDTAERVKATIAGGLAVAVCGVGGRRLGRCDRTPCAIVYIDTSRNGRRRYCSRTCATRVNVAAHRRRATE